MGGGDFAGINVGTASTGIDGITAYTDNVSGTTSDATGTRTAAEIDSGAITTDGLTGLAAETYANGGSVTGGVTGIYIYPGISGATVDNRYGVYIDDGGGSVTGGDYGIYQVATYEKNYFGGKVGIGTASPLAQTHVMGTLTSPAAGPIAYTYSGELGSEFYAYPDTLTQVTAAPTADTNGATFLTGATTWVDLPSSNAHSVLDALGVQGIVTNESTTTNNGYVVISGVQGELYNTGNVGNITGVDGFLESDSGTVNEAAGGQFLSYVGGTVTGLDGVYTQAILTGTATGVSGMTANAAIYSGSISADGLTGISALIDAAGGTVTGGVTGVYVDATIDGATVDNRFGVYIDDGGGSVTGGDYGIYQVATYEKNYFGGKVGIGTTAPAYLLHVGSASASGIVEELRNSSGNCTFTPSSSSLITICSSDQRLKEDIEDAAAALPQLADMRVRDFTIKASGERKTGVIAQEMIWKHPDMVHMGPEGMYGVEAPNVWLLVKAIQELKAANDDLVERVSADDDAVKEAKDAAREAKDALKAANDNISELRERLDALEAR